MVYYMLPGHHPFMQATERSHSSPSPLNAGRRNLLKGGFATLAGASLFASPVVGSAVAGSRLVDPKPVRTGRAVKKPADMGALFETMKREATPEQLYRFLYAMPKGGDLHHHLGGGFLPHMWWAIATDRQRNGGQRFYTRYRITSRQPHPLLNQPGVSHVFLWRTLNEKNFRSLGEEFQRDLKPLEELDENERKAWMSAVVLDEKGEGRDEFFEYHWTRLGDLLSSIHVMSELTVENMKRFGAEGVRYLEIQRGAFGYRDADGEQISAEEADDYWEARLAEKDALATGVTVRWQGIVLRFADDAEVMVRRYFAHMDTRRNHWVGINMAGREDDNRGYPRRFTKVYDEMLRRYPGIGISIHAGEAEKPDRHIRDTLRLGATRIGHGINLIRDEDTFLRMRDSRFVVEINLISNELLGYVPDPSQHPFPVYLRQGVPCCLNTDDRGMWDSNFTDEVFVAVSRFHLSWEEVVQLARTSYAHCFAEPELKASLTSAFESDLNAFAKQFSEANWQKVCDSVPAITHGYGKRVLGLQLER